MSNINLISIKNVIKSYKILLFLNYAISILGYKSSFLSNESNDL